MNYFQAKNNANKMIAIAAALFIAVFFMTLNVAAETMSSGNYKIESDSLNFGGGNSNSSTYSIEDSMGEVGTGYSSSTNYLMHAGYQQYGVTTLSVTAPSNVVLSPALGGITGGTSDGSTSFIVTTDNPAGYTATIVASSSPALVSATDSFADYVPAGGVPDFTFTNSVTDSSFAFSPEGNDIADRFKDNGSSCNIPAGSDTASACWDGLSTSPKTILNRTNANTPGGTQTTLRFKAASGSSHVQLDGVYTATTTVTVIPL